MAALTSKQSPHYENGLLLARDGTPLATVGFHRLDWYVSRSLGEEVIDYHDKRFPRVIRLTFDHGRPDAVKPCDLEVVENRCVVCGDTLGLTTHHVLPYRVKRHYPARLKGHDRAHCVLVCEKHHVLAEERIRSVEDPHHDFTRLVAQITNAFSRALGKLRPLYIRLWLLRHGGYTAVTKRYVASFMTLDPKYLPKGWLE